jgi:hypothetical protein
MKLKTFRVCFSMLSIAVLLFQSVIPSSTQVRNSSRDDRKSSHLRMGMTPDDLEMLERAVTVVCLERQTDPKGSIPIDDMQARPSLPIQSPEAIAGAERAQRLLPIARELVLASLQQLAKQYQFPKTKSHARELQSAMARVRSVRKIKPDMDSRDNASVLLRHPHTITFGTIFLAGLPSDEGMISVLAHELAHIADGDADSLRMLFRNIGNRASTLTALSIHGQRAEELTCDLIGALAVRDFVASSPSYEPIARRIARSVEHNCVDEDEGDEDHLSPRNTIRALLALNPSLTRELVYDREERPATKRN